ncbi:protein-L-isoaspartate(D-aspartate) O-methyltransferase [endosymbiont GvMRE of Glomus versiforme]|uniref:protein-L-isoaspartate(D-aspartate) O-methyltransferase n=1 Tax=endosymbiont GvMRE of Glomus versiforme TaxID=2039283 RepID=UPI000EB8FA9A|nr:protein-L-isoaspartate(D-aspartate) O-methyltransferase [endosymbiont GvMRE of Glomus versiforme]RHZ35654.1 Protein-L-isoaspartate O-methyltransferase [endosymbiont GvMRE of Glomus versiforme]
MKYPYPHLEVQGITSQKVLTTIRSLPRELFISSEFQEVAYCDSALPIDCGQTISQPFIVAYMTEKLELKETDKVLEIGTGSGFQAAVLAQLAKEIYTIEVHEELSKKAQSLLNKSNFNNIHYKIGDGKKGWLELAPFDKIIITAVATEIPSLLLEQLKVGGRMILPLELETEEQYLVLVKKLAEDKIEKQKLIQVKFVNLK